MFKKNEVKVRHLTNFFPVVLFCLKSKRKALQNNAFSFNLTLLFSFLTRFQGLKPGAPGKEPAIRTKPEIKIEKPKK